MSGPGATTRRNWAGAADLDPLIRFGQRIWSLAHRWHIGDLAWDIGRHPEGRPQWRMSLWERDGRIVAWGWLELPDGLNLAVDRDHADLVDAVLDWADAVAGVPVHVTVLDTEAWQIDPLVRRGYTADTGGSFFLAHHRALTDLPPVPALPDGFTVRPTHGDTEVPARAALDREIWSPTSLPEPVFREMTRRYPYRRDFDQVVEAPDGRLVAYVLGWYDEVNGCGEFEPVGTVPQFRRLGLSRAVGISVLRAFRDAGGELALVYARGDDGYPVPRQVYAALGFRPHGRTVTYRPPANRPPG